MTSVTLTSENVKAVIDPADGNRITSLKAFGLETLRPRKPSAMNWGCFPMVPFAGRISRGVIRFEGTTYALPTTFGGHAIHGYGYTNPWSINDVSDHSLTSTWMFCDPWPWRGRADYSIQLTKNGVELKLTATAFERQPLSLGFHPWFADNVTGHDRHTLAFDAAEMYETVGSIPTGRTLPPSSPPWDACFRRLANNPVLRWGDLSLEISSSADHWVVYNQLDDTVCVEPQTGPPNQANDDPQVFDPGEQLSITATLSFDYKPG